MTAPDAPQLSVLIATRNRADLLTRCLRSLEVAQDAAAQDAAATDVECLVIDNGSTDDTAAVLAQWERSGRGHRQLFVEQPGKSRALNHALEHARAPLLVFTDDDVEVPPSFFAEILAFFAGHPEYAAAIGRVLPPPGGIEADLQARIARYRTIAFFDHGDTVRDESSLHGSNMVLRRMAFDTVGGFNESLGPGATGGMEDQELGTRVRRSGLRIGYMPKVIVHHCIDSTRLTPEYFHRFQLVQARSYVAINPHGAWRRAVPRVLEATLAWAWWSVLRQPVRREHAYGRVLRHREILRLRWNQRR